MQKSKLEKLQQKLAEATELVKTYEESAQAKQSQPYGSCFFTPAMQTNAIAYYKEEQQEAQRKLDAYIRQNTTTPSMSKSS